MGDEMIVSIEDRLSGGGKATRAHPVKQRPFPYEHKSTWSIQNFKHYTCALDLTKCRSIQEKMLFAQHTAARFSFNHNINTHLARLSIVENTIPTPNSAFKEKALHALGNLNVSAENQSQIKLYLNEVCRENVSHCCNLLLQQAGLNLLISMTVINNMLPKFVSDLKIPLITEQSGCVELQGLQPLIALSSKPVMAGDFLGAQMPYRC
ncbi:protein ARMCX6-like [Suncus etruscus]|uniref:protein ARMCX6-like n=1 Tax=Suncus etruscus TaxID=109475 RepID=UPI0021107F24|nr:protein ARMCX6-like [Suncus etruscus]